MRLFIAVQLSDEIKGALLACMRDLKRQGIKGNYVPEQNLHLTLAFIGDYENTAKVRKAIESVPEPHFRLKLSKSGNFGNILWAGVEESEQLDTYVTELKAALEDFEIPFDKKKFVPHITLVRKASGKPHKFYMAEAGMAVRKASLMKSEIKNGKVIYTELDERGEI